MSEEQKRQWALIGLYVEICKGSPSILGEVMALSGMSKQDLEDIISIKNSFTEQIKP